MAKIDILIPCYKSENTLADTIMSVWTQDFQDYNLITRDDVFGKGLADNLNHLVKESTSEILVFLSADDILLPGALRIIYDTFHANKEIGMLIRPYYWFKDSWLKPVRKTKVSNFKIEDIVMLCGQLSGIAVRKECLTKDFEPLTFVEFASGVLPIIKNHEVKILEKPTVAVRIGSSESCRSWVYEQSPTLNWLKVIEDNFKDNELLIVYFKAKLASNFIGLIQIRMYGGWKKVMREVGILFNLEPLIMFHPKFWFYFALIQFPSQILKILRNWFMFTINRRLCR